MSIDLNIDLLCFIWIVFMPVIMIPIWLLSLRPFLEENGVTRATGITWGMSMWVDWFHAVSVSKNTGRQCWACWCFLLLHLVWVALLAGLFVKYI